MSNPWTQIDLHDYENHMRLDTVLQLQELNQIMREQFTAYPAESIMILGIAGGNGLEHIDRKAIRLVYGVDVNPTYLDECKKRYPALDQIFHPICADLSENNLQLSHADLLVANLLIEYIGYACFQNVAKTVKPHYISCVIQINTDDSFVSESPYLHAFDQLSEVHHHIEEDDLVHYMEEIGYTKKLVQERDLPNGKKFLRIDFVL